MFSVWECLILLEKEAKGYLHGEKIQLYIIKRMKGKLEGAIAPSTPILIPSYISLTTCCALIIMKVICL